MLNRHGQRCRNPVTETGPAALLVRIYLFYLCIFIWPQRTFIKKVCNKETGTDISWVSIKPFYEQFDRFMEMMKIKNRKSFFFSKWHTESWCVFVIGGAEMDDGTCAVWISIVSRKSCSRNCRSFKMCCRLSIILLVLLDILLPVAT